jgi:hypothetical protein
MNDPWIRPLPGVSPALAAPWHEEQHKPSVHLLLTSVTPTRTSTRLGLHVAELLTRVKVEVTSTDMGGRPSGGSRTRVPASRTTRTHSSSSPRRSLPPTP